MNLNSIVQPNMNVARSINIDRDFGKTGVINDYQITGKSLEILSRFADSLEGERVNAWSLTGPYGMGKSAFVNYLLTLMGSLSEPVNNTAMKKLKNKDMDLYNRLYKGMLKIAGEKGFLRIPVAAGYEPINVSLAKALVKVINTHSFPGKRGTQSELKDILQKKMIESSALCAVFLNIQKKIGKPLAIVVDEFGKNLDYMSSHHEDGDIFIIQQLAEMESTYLWVCLHQSFEGYATGLSPLHRHEWNKVQGRFEDISFVESTEQMLFLMRKALRHNFKKYKKPLTVWANKALGFIGKTSMDEQIEFTQGNIMAIYPFHPVAAIALIELCIQFGQNDRTLLSFISSNDRLALSNFLEKTKHNKDSNLPSMGLDYLYDYFFNISSTAYINRPGAQRWIEVHDTINSYLDISDLEKKILKTIGVMNLLSKSLGVNSSKEVVIDIFEQTSNAERLSVERGLDNLIDRGILLYRRYAGELRIWEGSDFNVEQSITEKKEKLEVSRLEHTLQTYAPLQPIIAPRHSHETGTIRRFECKWLSADDLSKELAPKGGFDGLLLYSFGVAREPEIVAQVCADGRPLIIAYTRSYETLKMLALDVAAARLVLSDSIELHHDGVARKEVKYRIKVAEETFRLYLEKLFTPGSEKVVWYVKGVKTPIKNMRELSSILSDLCDEYYCDSPPIRNEMISYEKLSSATSRARRLLVEAMVVKEKEENLGFKGFGPEVAIYKSLLQVEKLHVKDKQNGCWKFTLDASRNGRYQKLWSAINQYLDDARDGVTVEEILDMLSKPTFGMRLGPSPIYIILYLIVNADSIAVFQEGTYLPYLNEADVALMTRRPDVFSIKKYVFNEQDREIFKVYSKVLNTMPTNVQEQLRNVNLLSIVGPLIDFVERLPPYSLNTKRISSKAKKVRLSIKNSVDPVQLIFEDIPNALGVDMNVKGMEIHKEYLQEELSSILLELANAFTDLLEGIQKSMLEAFNCNTRSELVEKQKHRAKSLVGACDDKEVKRILLAMQRKSADETEWAKGLAGIILGKPIESWRDSDFEIFESRLHDYVNRIEHLEALVFTKNSSLHGNSSVLSMMMPNGRVKRMVIAENEADQKVVQEALDFISSYSKDEVKAILLAITEEVLGGNKDEQ